MPLASNANEPAIRLERGFASSGAISRLAAKQLAVTHVSTGTVDIPLDGTEGGDMAARPRSASATATPR